MRNKGQTPNNWQLQIRQIKTEIMKYIDIHIHLKAQSKLKKKNAINSPGEKRK